MKVASCAVDFPLARSLAELLYGAVLLSAFLVGLPILAYLALCLIALLALRRSLRKSSATAAAAPWKDWPVGARTAFAASMLLATLVLLGR